MDNSQSSNFFDDAPDLLSESFSERELFSYESVLAATKDKFSGYKNEIKKSTFPSYFSTILENSLACITHSLEDLIKGLLSDTTAPINKIVGYLDDCVFLLQMLINFYKSIIESVSMSCGSMKTFPKQTGMIIFTVFVHCRDSESIYAHHLRSVEKQLKDLFRICHELQLTYLQILEKHFILNMAELEDKNVLEEALKINLSIGKVVQSLDVKTMAEQWKAFTAICEKYANDLMSTNIFEDCTLVLSNLIKDNLETALEISQDEKVTLRSLKVAAFTIKILLKICNTFRHSPNKNYNHIIELLQHIQIKISACLETSAEKSVTTIVLSSSDILLKELLLDEEFANCLFNSVSLNCDDEKLNDEDLLGSLLLITAAMKFTTQTNGRYTNDLKRKLIDCVYSLLPYCHIWSRRTLRFTVPNQTRPYSIFEYVLIHTTALSLTMTNDEFNVLEKHMIEAILSTDCVSAMFSANLWTLLARYTGPQLLFNQVIWLCTMYKKLDRHGFDRSPQRIHLSYTISSIFKAMEVEDKLKICKQFRINDEDNIRVWFALRISNLPVESQRNAEDVIVEKLKGVFRHLHESDSVDLLVDITNLAATCTFKSSRGIDDYLVRAWSKVCQEKQSIAQGLDNNTLWFYDYIKALVALTDSAMGILREKGANFLKVLHVISNLIKTGDAEMKLILINILCKLATYEIHEHKILIKSHYTEAFTSLLQDSNDIVRNSIIKSLRAQKHNKYLYNQVIDIKTRDSESWQNETNIIPKDLNINVTYIHKCLESKNTENTISVQELKEANLDDFYFDSGGSEMLVETEPSCKRGKSNAHEVDSIIRSLEENVMLLLSKTVTTDQLVRISNVCENLKNISH